MAEIEYNILHDMKKINASISLHDLLSSEQQLKLLLNNLNDIIVAWKKVVVKVTIMKKSKYQNPTFPLNS